jgi:glycosyltransferase involved in cell wall biosynthesis
VLSICAVIGARNERTYLQVVLPLLAGQGIEVVVVDNDSSDGSQDLYESHRGDPIIGVKHLPYKGYLSMTDLLLAKRAVYQEVEHDWVIHLDADEVLEHAQPGRSLADAILEADDAGYDALNFEEFVFLPEPHADFSERGDFTQMLRYYLFEPRKNHRNLAWRRRPGLDSLLTAGHTLPEDRVRMSPNNGVLRHYVVLSEDHARRKYLERKFDPREVARGWHGNRLTISEESLAFPRASTWLFELSEPASKAFRRERPVSRHYWEWPRGG